MNAPGVSPPIPPRVPPDGAGGVSREAPWPGLSPFTESQSEFFRGREEEAEEILRLIRREPLTVVYGKSGLGKTSVLQAGLMPRLRAAEFLPVYLRLDHSDGGPDLVQQVRVALTTALDAARVDGPRPSDTETLWEFFHRDGADFWSVRNRLVTPILILDQFEEAFTLARRSEAARQRVRDFSAELSALVDGRPPASVARRFEARPTSTEDFDFDRQACRIVLALREDFLPDFEALRGRYPAIGQNWFRLESLRGDRALEAVLEPGAGLVDQAAAIRIVDFVSTSRQRTARADEPPPLPEELANRRVQPAHLSIVCHQLNERRIRLGQPGITADLIFGSRDQIVRDFYTQAMTGVPPPLRFFLEDELLTGSGFRDRAALEDALESCGPEPSARALAEEAIQRLIVGRILHREEIGGIAWIELSHDLLTEVVLASRNERTVREAAERAKERQSRDRRRIWGLGLAAVFFAALGLAALVLLFLTVKLSEGENRALEQAQEATRTAEAETRRAEQQAARAAEMAERARGLTRFVLFDLRNSLQDIRQPSLLLGVCSTMVDYYRGDSSTNRSAEEWRERSVAFNNLGIAYFSLTNYTAALTNYQEGALSVSNALARDPSEWLYRDDLRICQGNVARTLRRLNRTNEAIAAFAVTAEVAATLADPPGNPPPFEAPADKRKEWFSLWHAIQIERADYLFALGFHDLALEAALANLSRTVPRWTNAFPDSADALRALAIGEEKAGRILEATGSLDEAFRRFSAGVEHAHRFAAARTNPPAPPAEWLDPLRVLRVNYLTLGRLQLKRRDWWGAWSNRLESLRYARVAAAVAGTNHLDALQGLSIALRDAATVARGLGLPEATSLLAETVEVQQRVVDLAPVDESEKTTLVQYTDDYVDALVAATNHTAALAVREAQLAVRRSEALLDDSLGRLFGQSKELWRRQNAYPLIALCSAYDQVGDILVLMGPDGLARAFEARTNCLAIRRRLVDLADEPEIGAIRSRNVAITLRWTGQVLLRQGRPGDAAPFFAEALRIGTNGLAAAPGDAEWTEAVQSAWIDAGEGWLAEGRIDEARQGFERALDFARRRIDLDPADAEQRTALLSVAGSIARLWEKSGRLSDAATHWTRVAEWFGKQADAASDAKVRGGLRQARGKAEWELGALYEAADRPDHAREALRAGALLQAEVLDDLALSPGVRVSELGNLSFHLVKAGEFDRARQAAESALAISPDSLWIIQNLGHARMFLGEYDAARDLNRRHARVANVATGNRPLSWAAAARGDFAAFRRLRICTPEVEAVMKEIEALLPPTDTAP